jgi:hypothetical protein
MTTHEILSAFHRRGVRLSRHGDRLVIDAPDQELTDTDCQLLTAHKERLLKVVDFEPELAVLVLWFHEALRAGRLPREPFALTAWNHIVNPARYYAALEVDVANGPHGARARLGGLRDSLRRLRMLVGECWIGAE